MEKGGGSSGETERQGWGTGRHWGRMPGGSWGAVERDLKRLGRMGQGWGNMEEK